jgi:hypothetical protein
MKALLAQGYDAIFVGCGAPRGRDLDLPGRREAAAHVHIGIDWLASVSFGHVTQHRQARDRAGRRQHRDGLLPLGAPPGRHRRQGHRAQRLRGDEGLALGEGRRDARGHPDHQLPRAQGLRARGRQAHRHDLRGRQGRVRRAGPAQPGAHRRAGRLLRMRRRAGRGRPGERLPLDRARLRHRLRRVGPAQAGQGHLPVHRAQRVLRRRRGLRAQEHHHRRGARPRGGRVHRQAAERRGPATCGRRPPST